MDQDIEQIIESSAHLENNSVEEFTSEILSIMREAAEETGTPCSKFLEDLRGKISERVSQMFNKLRGTGKGTKRKRNESFKEDEVLEDGKVDDEFLADISPIASRPTTSSLSLEGTDSLETKRGNSDSDISFSGLLDEEDFPQNTSPVLQKKKKRKLNKSKHLTPTTGFVMPAPKKRSVQRKTPEPPPPVELNVDILDTMDIEISDYNSDHSDEGGDNESLAPSWAKRKRILEVVGKQTKIDPDTVFGRVMGGSMCDLAKIFQGHTPNFEKYNKRRTMSGNWSLDKLQLEEEVGYRVAMEYDTDTPQIIPPGAKLVEPSSRETSPVSPVSNSPTLL